jgi:aspartate carbamoyltransferase regulatory subunit
MDPTLEGRAKTKTLRSKQVYTTFRLGNSSLTITLKLQATKGKIDQSDFIKVKNFCVSKNPINK